LIDLSDFVKEKRDIIVIVGLPLKIKNSLFNVAAVLSNEGIIGLVPKKFLPNSDEFQEKRWFATGTGIGEFNVDINNEVVPITSEGMVFTSPYGNFGIEICEDLWTPLPPSSEPIMQDADIIFNLSASNELVGKYKYRKSLVLQQSARCSSAYVYASAGVGESSTDLVFSGACIISENGRLLTESKRFSLDSEVIIADIDITSLRHDKLVDTNIIYNASGYLIEIECPIVPISPEKMYRSFNPYPFIPSKGEENDSFTDLFNIQTHGLAKRLLHTGVDKAVIGISGGLDSTLALLVVVKTFDLLGYPRENIFGITMPGFGTTDRTYSNAVSLMKSAGITVKEISITDAVMHHFDSIGHDPAIHDVTYENSQARERTQILMDFANKVGGLVVGTGNMSELALGWATYNGDHMSMYGVNSGVPKTLVSSLVRWIADTQLDNATSKILHDILDTPFSPELLPADNEGKIAQKTEHFVGPYELHDFFLHRMIRFGDRPKRILFMATLAFKEKYSSDEIQKWLRVFYKRFFEQQFKRSCMPDGPKVGTVNLSPRGSWRMPSDAVLKIWTDEIE
jgi:NAD+ synthase (glutamine-hydrolysing)